MQRSEFIYVGDVMCSWCWGFAPTLERLQESFELPIRVVNGGLRPGANAEVLDDRMAQYLGHHWEQVEAASGQPFNRAFLDRRDGWRYDTELPAIAVTTMRSLAPATTLPFFTHLQRSFYADGVDLTDQSRYPELLDGFPVAKEAFMDRLASTEMKWAAWEDFEEARSMGIAGFPALLLRLDGSLALVTRGFAPYERLEQPLVDFLRERLGEEQLGEVCSIEGVC